MKQKYFIVDSSSDPKLIGSDYPQAYNFIKEYNPRATHALFDFYNCLNAYTFPDYIPDFSGIRMSGRAKLTDIVSNGFDYQLTILHPQVKAILEEYNLPPHRFYEMNLYLRKVCHEYYMLYVLCDDYSEMVDYEKSTFVLRHRGEPDLPLIIRSREEYFACREKVREQYEMSASVTTTYVQMNEAFGALDLDYFYLIYLGGGKFISERLMNRLLEEQVTGWEYKPALNLGIE